MLLLLPILTLCELKLSDNILRLPIWVEGTPTKPFQEVSSNYPDVQFISQNDDLISIEPVKSNSRNTVVRVVVNYHGVEPMASEITATYNGESAKIQVYIDIIHHITISSTVESLYVNSYCKFKLYALSKSNIYFTSLNGVNVEWDSEDKEDRPFILPPIEETPLKTKYKDSLPVFLMILKPTRIADTVLTCRLPDYADVPTARQTLNFVDPILFYPNRVYLMPGAETTLNLYQAYVTKNNEVVTNHLESDRIDLSRNNETDSYSIFSTNTTIATVSKSALVHANIVGRTSVIARDMKLIVSITNADIIVRLPDNSVWPPQWIKYRCKEAGTKGPFEPNTDTIELISDGHTLIKPVNLQWDVSNAYLTPGRHSVSASPANIKNFTVTGIVYTCPPPVIDPPSVRIPLGHDGYEFVIRGGSGFFKYEYDHNVISFDENASTRKEEDGYVITKHVITTHNVGETTIKVYDTKLEGYHCELKVYISNLVSVTPYLDHTELYVNDILPVRTVGYDENNNQFDFITKAVIEAEDPSIISSDLVGLRQGFTHITVTVDSMQSEKKLISVIEHLNVGSPLVGTSLVPIYLVRRGGPVRWGNSSQINQVDCGNVKVAFNEIKQSITFDQDFIGECTLIVQNEKTELNKNPIRAEKKFQVISKSISHLGLFPFDEHANDDPQCNFVNSTIFDNTTIISEVRIPYGHNMSLNLYAFGKDNENLAIFNDPNTNIIATTTSGNTFVVTDSFTVTEDVTISIETDKTLTTQKLHVKVIMPHSINEELPFILYAKNTLPTVAQIIDGSGIFFLKGDAAEIDERKFLVYPNQQSSRIVTIFDKCIPENKLEIPVQTESAASLLIEGPHDAVIGQTLEFTTSLLTSEGKKISPKSYQHIKWTAYPENLRLNPETGKWEITMTEAGRFEIELIADDVRRTHDINVYETMQFPYDSITMFVDEKKTLKVYGGPEKLDMIKIESTNNDIVAIEDNAIAHALKSGSIDVIASVPENPKIGPATLHIRVLDAKDLILDYDSDHVYVGSYVHIRPFIETDNGQIPASSVGWNVDGNDQWEKLYDNSLIVQGTKEGVVIITATTPQHLSKTITIYFDYKLTILDPEHIKIPIGSSYNVQIENNLDVTYTLTPLNADQGMKYTSISKEGTITAGSEGRYILVVQYKQQWQSRSVSITAPKMMLLQSLAAQVVRPRVIDPDSQLYSPFNGSIVEFNQSYAVVNYDGSYTFDVPVEFTKPVLVSTTVSIPNYWELSHETLLYPRKLIYPTNPTIQEGATILLKCQDPKQDFKSFNPRVASVTKGGLVSAHSIGKTIIQCTPEIETVVTVVKVESVSLKKIADDLYRIDKQFSTQSIDQTNLTFADDIYYKCKWDAIECGKVRHIVNNGADYCKIEYYPKRLCPTHSYLEVTVESANANLKLKGGIDVKSNATAFLITPTIVVSFSKFQRYQDISLAPANTDDITYELPLGMGITFIKPSVARLEVFPAFGQQGDVIFEHKKTGERVRVTVIRGNFSWASIYLSISHHEWDNVLFYISVVLTIAISIYIAYNLEAGQLLLPYSPYKTGKPHKKAQ
ncbi:hypothetical protein TRFO_12669 [Tritrichomonas foetus]|uniref:BIG2 domain-containing protein n=1 Tax=Tritrichomonas foetus TaxID=1144522 RepID=A0A1J4L570_9EUKA|nr:hypothetical protein TRFO_12669 [Tritrichomonas foetus]|eukprot:OHT17140.1 hypothetical protein TRFO_12669 [Tritrichomonas foetus]